MTEKNRIDVFINGRNFTVVGNESSEYVYKLAAYVDGKIKEMTDKNDKLSGSMAAILAALNIADELHQTIQELSTLKKQTKTPVEEYEMLIKQSEDAKEELSQLRAKYLRTKEQLDSIRDQNRRLNSANEKNNQALKLKEKELYNGQNMIKKLQDKIFDNQIQLIETKKELEEILKLYDEKSISDKKEI
ncbi:MAG: cell division protein ZapA [Tissierellia bacterium]|nr:cell division protein ZapA [Tissierellia bacterium]